MYCRSIPVAVIILLLALPGLAAQDPPGPGDGDLPSPAAHFGFDIGADRELADWTELTDYYSRLAEASPRVTVDTLGPSTMGRPFVMLTITSEENHARLEELRDIQQKLSDPRTIAGPEELEDLVDRGRAVVLVTHGIHSTEVGSAQMPVRLVHRLASSDAPEIREILDNVVVLDIPSLNPDGTQWIADWYRRWVGTEHEASPLPWLYHFYVGHDNNRDWYAFTQAETRLAVSGAHNAWHPHIVHDIHQMGGTGPRIFVPPYVEPWEPNVDPAVTTAVNDLGTWMAARLQEEGKDGVVVNAIYDAFTPARAYQHYHAGVRILSETASARLATPDTLRPWQLRARRGFDPHSRTWNHPSPWEGGRWGLPEIVDYMDSATMALLSHAARNRRHWIRNAYRINERAVEGWDEWPEAWVIRSDPAEDPGAAELLRILRTGEVEVHRAERGFEAAGASFPAGVHVVPMRQPYASFAQTLLEVQRYPDLREYPGGPPQRPYDVTAHTLPLLLDVEVVSVPDLPELELSEPVPVPDVHFPLPAALDGPDAPRIAIYKSRQETREAGWTRWLFDRHGLRYDTLRDEGIRRGDLRERYDVVLLQSQERNSIMEGWSRGQVPPEWTGGLGLEGSRSLRRFVRNGGRLVAIEDATEFAVGLFGLDVFNEVERLPDGDFFAPGSILRLTSDGDHPITDGVAEETAAWYWESSRAFSVTDPTIEVLARYGEDDPLLSGWILGSEHLAGRPALLEASVGRGSVILFGFQPNYRGQSMATWPLLFNALIPDETGRTAGGDS